jgi:hypothetical protein
MSTQPHAANAPIYDRTRLTEKQLSLLKMQLTGLRRLSDATGFSTNKLVIDMLSRVSPADLILLGLLFTPEVEGNR